MRKRDRIGLNGVSANRTTGGTAIAVREAVSGLPSRAQGDPAMLKRRIILVDDHPLFRNGLRRILD